MTVGRSTYSYPLGIGLNDEVSQTFTLLLQQDGPLTNQPIDPETLASFLDGTLSDAERERVLESLAQGGEAYDDFVEARALLDAQSPARGALAAPHLSAPGRPRPLRAAAWKPNVWRNRRTVGIGGFLAAAGITTILLLGRGTKAGTPALLAVESVSDGLSAVTDLDARFDTSWNEPKWAALRGTVESVNDRAYAFRLGVRYTQFSVAVSATDTRYKRPASRALAELAASVVTGPPVAARVEQLALTNGSGAAAEERRRVATELRALTSNPSWFDLGVWSEAARLAAKADDGAFFSADQPTMDVLSDIVAKLERAPRDERATMDSIIEPLRRLRQRGGNAATDLPGVATMLDSVVARGGR